MRMVAPDDYPPALAGSHVEKRLRKLGELVIYDSIPKNEAELIERVKDANVIIGIRGGIPHFTRDVITRCTKLKHISVWGAGVDHVDLETCKARHIRVTNTSRSNMVSVAECAFALAINLARRMNANDRIVREGNWHEARRGLLQQLSGHVLGVVGAGPIAQHMMQIGRGVGMKVVAWTFHPSEERAKQFNVRFVPLDELMSTADVVSVHLPLTNESRCIIGRKQLALMKPTGIIVNTGRGSVIDEEALIETLTNKKIYGAGLDVFSTEPLPRNHPFTKLQNVVLSPHKGGGTKESLTLGLTMTADNIENVLKGTPTNIIV